MLLPTVLGVPGAQSLLLLKAQGVKDAKTSREFALDNFECDPPEHVLSYERLSRSAEHLPAHVRLIICDEADALLNAKSTRTRALKAFVRRTGAKLVGLTATWGKDDTVSSGQLINLFLGDLSPYPLSYNTLKSLALCMDEAKPWGEWPTGRDRDATAPLCLSKVEKDVREAFGKVFRSSPAVVTAQTQSCSEPLRLVPFEVELNARTRECIEQAKTSFCVEGDEVDDYLALDRQLCALRTGFYTRRIDDGRPRSWYTARRDFMVAVREGGYINREGTETVPRVVAAIRRGKHKEIHRLFEAWEAHRVAYPNLPPSEVVVTDDTVFPRLDDFVRANSALMFYERSATPSLTSLEVWPLGREAPTGRRPLALSRRSYGVGRNLQEWSSAVVLSLPSDPVTLEQLLGRLHRQGQKEAVTFYFHSDDTEALDKATALSYSLTQKGRGPYKVCGLPGGPFDKVNL
jgi:hypothetical protein